RLALLSVQLPGLLLEQPVDVRIAAVSENPLRMHERLQSRRRVAEGGGAACDDVAQLLLPVLGEEGRALERPDLGADAHGLPVVDDGLADAAVGDVDKVFAGIDTVRVPGLGEELPGL